MVEKNPRSRLRQMKRKYFFTTAGTFTAVFLVLILFEAVFSTIFELSPTWRMAIVLGIFVLDIWMTYYLVNKNYEQKWLRPVPEVKVVEIKRKPAVHTKAEEKSQAEKEENKTKEDTELVKLENLVDDTIAKEKK